MDIVLSEQGEERQKPGQKIGNKRRKQMKKENLFLSGRNARGE
ncbi:hypothetical protein [Chimaeribacter californicus]|nr:hypothetical protein [Chimaeribacter californicus]